LSGWVARLWPIGAALGAGALAAVAHPPFGFWPGFFGYAVLLWLLDREAGKGRLWRAFGIGWLAGFAYFLIGCWWVAEAFLVDAEHQAWMAPFAAVLLPAGLGLFWGGACALWRKIAPDHLGRVFVFAAVFSLFEWLRGHVLTGFPWNLPGETWAAGSAPSQAASWLGAYGMTIVTVFAMAAFAPLFHPGPRKRRIGMAVLGVLTVAGLWIFGAVRLSGAHGHDTTTYVRVIQPDVPQESKWTEASFRGIVLRYVNLTGRQGKRYPDVVIWPEGALPASAEDILAPDSWVGPAIARSMLPGQTLLMGTYRAQPQKKGPPRYYNSLYALQKTPDGSLKTVAAYDKHRLVPFGEYLPLEPAMTALGLKDLAHVGDGFSSGPRPKPMPLPGLPDVQPLICYESLFPGLAADGPGRPAWIVNVSNDAWFGPTSGPRQHLNLAAYRAIEQGLPIVRATPTGVSAVIDAYGRIGRGQRLEPGESGVIDAFLPAPAPETLYARIGDLIFWLLTACALGAALWGRPLRMKFTR
jgi:apolipoprotein N-acyltransferase